MADDKNNPFSVRMDPDDKEKLIKLIQESGSSSNKDFMNVLMSAYILNKVKVEVPEASESITKVEELTQLINDYFVNMSKQIKTTKECMNLQFTKDVDVYKSKLDSLKDENGKIDGELDLLKIAYNNTCSDNEDYRNQVEQLRESIKDKTSLVEEYKSRNDTLNGLVNEYKAAKEENEELKIKLNEANLANIKVNNESVNKGKEIEMFKDSMNSLSAQLQETKNQNKADKEELVAQYKVDMATLKEQSKIDEEKALHDITKSMIAEKREAIIGLKEEHQVNVQDVHNEYSKKIDEYQEKYKKLLEELEQIKTVEKNIEKK